MIDFLASYWWVFGLGAVVSIVTLVYMWVIKMKNISLAAWRGVHSVENSEQGAVVLSNSVREAGRSTISGFFISVALYGLALICAAAFVVGGIVAIIRAVK